MLCHLVYQQQLKTPKTVEIYFSFFFHIFYALLQTHLVDVFLSTIVFIIFFRAINTACYSLAPVDIASKSLRIKQLYG